jgi:membrane protease YdiL (CAAX protease family)
MLPSVSPPRLDELVSPGRRFALGIALLGAHFLVGGSGIWGFLPDPLPLAIGPLITLVPALLLTRWLGASVRESFAFHWPSPTQLGWAALTGIALVLPSRILGAINTQLIEPADWFVESMEELIPTGPQEWVSHLILIGLLVPVAEETVFRGLLQPAAGPAFGPARAAVIIGVMFALFHFSPWFLLPLAVIGMVLGVTRWITGSVIACIAVHGAYNTGSVVLGEWMKHVSEDGQTVPALVAGLLTGGAFVSAWLCWTALGRLRPVRPATGENETPAGDG